MRELKNNEIMAVSGAGSAEDGLKYGTIVGNVISGILSFFSIKGDLGKIIGGLGQLIGSLIDKYKK